MTAPAITRTMLLWCPDWPITAARQAHGLAAELPIALIEKGKVFACSAAARVDGVSRGIRVREAQSRCPDLIVLAYDASLDNRAFEPIIAAVELLAAGVQVVRPGVCAVRVRGPSRYYGGEKPAALALIGVLDDLGIEGVRVGVADGPFTAEMAARSTRNVFIVAEGGAAEFLAPLPITTLGAPELVDLLLKLGVRTLADFAALPITSVSGRFGAAGTRLHSLASGLDSRPVTARIAPPELDSSIDFEPPLDRIDQVAFSFRQRADEFIQRLTAASLVCTAVLVETWSDRGERVERSWLHPRSFTAADVVDRVRWQLQGDTGSGSGLTAGVTRVRVTPEAVDAIGNHEQGLWGTANDERIHHGLSRVQSMLGHGAVLTATVGGGRMLAERQKLLPWGDRAAAAQPGPWPGHLPPPLPATVFAIPRPVDLIGANGDTVAIDGRGILSAAPAHFSPTGSARELRPVLAWAGPWPIDERWWDAAHRRVASRFQVVDSSGVAWLLVLERRAWWAEARYD